MRWLHITQDEHGFWMLSLEEENGEMSLLAHQFTRPAHLIRDAIELVFGCETAASRFPDAQIIIDPPRGKVSESTEEWPEKYECPAARKASE